MDLMLAGRVGVSDVVLVGHDDAGTVVQRALDQSKAVRAGSGIMEMVEDVIPNPVRDVFAHCLTHAAMPLSISGVASALGYTRRTIARRLAASRMPALSRVIGWSRLVAAVAVLERSGRGAERIALDLGFDSAGALRNLLFRYTSLRLADVRLEGGCGIVLARFRRELGESEVDRRLMD